MSAEPSNYFGLRLARLTATEYVDAMRRSIVAGGILTATYLHFHSVNIIAEDAQARQLFSRFDVVAPDGIAVLLTSKLFGEGFRRENVLVMECVLPVFGPAACRHGWRIFLFGGQPGIAEMAGERLRERFPEISIVGTHHGYAGSEEEAAAVARTIAAAGPTIVLVALGQPRQEAWILRYGTTLGANVVVGVGGFLDKLAKNQNVYPAWVDRTHLYWLYRVFTERRLVWKRYSYGVLKFAWRVGFERLAMGGRR